MTVPLSNRVLSNAGAMFVALRETSVPSTAVGPWAKNSASGASYVIDLASSAVPATAVARGGRAFSQDGALYVTTDAPDSTTQKIGAQAVRGDGALHISYTEPAASDMAIGGVMHSQTGVMRASVSAAVVDAMTTTPDATRRGLIHDLILGLQGDLIWSQLDLLYIIAAATEQAGQLNWISPGNFTLIPVNSPTFLADRHYVGNGTTSYANTGWAPSALSSRVMSQNNCSAWAWVRNNVAENAAAIGNGSSHRFMVNGRTAGGNTQFAASDGSNSSAGANADSSGFWGVSRAISTTKKGWQNGAQFGSDISVASSGVPTAVQWICAINSTAFSTKQVAIAAWGAALTGLESAFYNRLATYMTAVGA